MPPPDHAYTLYHSTPISSRFLRLARELRDQIYFLALIEPPKWTKRHTAFCPLSDRLGLSPEQPPFMLVRNVPNAARRAVPQCSCAQRQGLGLLLANRQIHEEAAPIFWGSNVFCFDDSKMFASEVGDVLRKEYRKYIRHVSVMRAAYQFNQYVSSIPDEDFWNAVFECENLRSLELTVDCMKRCTVGSEKLRSRLPQLKSLTLAHLQIYELKPLKKTSYGWPDVWRAERESIYAKVAQDISLDVKRVTDAIALSDFQTNFFVHVNWEVRKNLLGQTPPGQMVQWPGQVLQWTGRPVLIAEVKDNNNNPALTLRNGQTVIVPFYGLASSRATRVRHAKERRAHEARLKAAGLPSTQETQLALLLKDAKDKKKEKQEVEELTASDSKKEEREKQRLDEEEAERKLQVNQEARKRRNIRRAEESKKEERKRVPKNS